MEQNLIIIQDLAINFDLETLGQQLRVRPGTKMEKILLTLTEEAQPLAKPKAAAKFSALEVLSDDEVRLDQAIFKSALLKHHVEGQGKAFPFLATEGQELSEWGRAYDGLERVFANAIQQAAMRLARTSLERTILEKFGLEQVSEMNPGSLTVWPITQQVPLFELLKPLPEKLGVTLLPTYMMKPEQTVSGILFQTDAKFHNCQLCPKTECPSRRVPYSGMY